jgi:predicted dehydrogenase
MTYLSIGLVGHGSVASSHVAALSGVPDVRVSAVLGRDAQRAARFADDIGALSFDDIVSFAAGLDLAIVASPSACHAEQAIALLERGVAVLIELPVARDADELTAIRAASPDDGVSIFATHTARFLAATELVGAALEDGRLGSIRTVTIERQVRHRDKGWLDDPLLHHGQHGFDLLDRWFGAVELHRAALTPDGTSVVVEGAVGQNTPFTLGVVHDGVDERMRVAIVGSRGWLRTDGFGRVEASPGIAVAGWVDREPANAYLAAIAHQDAAVVAAVRRIGAYPPIDAAARTTELVDVARGLARGR